MEHAGFWLSPQQERLFLATREGASANAIALIDATQFGSEQQVRDALQAAVNANEILRTVFRRMPGVKVPFQVVLPEAGIRWESVAGDPEHFIQAARAQTFDLENGPLVHAKWITGAAAPKLLLVMPAVLCDAASLQLLVQKFGSAAVPDEEAVTYVQFSQWQREFANADDEDAQAAKAYWETANSKLNAPPLPSVKASDAPFQLASVSFSLTADRVNRIAAFGEVESFLFAAWRVFLWRITAQQDGAIAVYAAGRQYDELRDLIGCVGKTIPVSLGIAAEARFSEVVQSGESTLQEALRWQDYYTGKLDSAYAAFEYLDHSGTAGIHKLEACGEPFALKLWARRTREALALELQYDAARLNTQTVTAWANYFERMLAAAIDNPDQLVTALPLLSEEDLQEITTAWNQTAAEYPRQSCFQQLFEAQAAQTPERVAVQMRTELPYLSGTEREGEPVGVCSARPWRRARCAGRSMCVARGIDDHCAARHPEGRRRVRSADCRSSASTPGNPDGGCGRARNRSAISSSAP